MLYTIQTSYDAIIKSRDIEKASALFISIFTNTSRPNI